MTNQRYLTDAEFYENYWDSVYEEEYRQHDGTDLDRAIISDRDWRDMRGDHDYEERREKQDE